MRMTFDSLGLFKQLSQSSIATETIFGKDFVVVGYVHFKPYLEYFLEPKQIGTAINFRTKGWLRHIHAIRRGDHVQIHLDYGNPYKSKLLLSIHFVYDVVPYFFWHLIHFKKPYQF